ncbi:RHS repeat domain-containing protein [Streptomyces sp. NPDC006530]|uniref:RHS repeat domain-containing protein n=1 Tax=Streptomyces sp. NPDC006530 TaxID=3364750 RepID=UPI00368D8C8C
MAGVRALLVHLLHRSRLLRRLRRHRAVHEEQRRFLHHPEGIFARPEEEHGRHLHPDEVEVRGEGDLQRQRLPDQGHRPQPRHHHRHPARRERREQGLQAHRDPLGRFIDLYKTYPSQWQAKDNTGRTAVYNLDASGNLATTTDTEGKTVTFGYDGSGRISKITTAEGPSGLHLRRRQPHHLHAARDRLQRLR